MASRLITLYYNIIQNSYTYDELLTENDNNSANSTISSIFGGAYGFLFGLALIGLVISLIVSGLTFVIYGNDPQKLAEAKGKLFRTLFLILAVSSVLFIVGLCMKIGESISL